MLTLGDLFDVLPTLAEASVDACVTDPPYGIGFMGREWDTFKPEVIAETAESGFLPHPIVSANPNLNGRKRAPAVSPSQIGYNRTVEGQREFQAWTERWAREVYRVLKPGGHLIVCGAPRSHHRMMSGLEDAGFEIRDCLAWMFGQGFPKSLNLGKGWGTALKPGHEPIALARKPFNGSTTDCHRINGTAGLNIDACRLDSAPPSEYRDKLDRLRRQRAGEPSAEQRYGDSGVTDFAMKPGPRGGDDLGRWPANVLLDEEAAALLDAQSGDCGANGGGLDTTSRQRQSGFAMTRGAWTDCDNSGGASRFYYVAKPSREERDYGTDGLIARPRDESRKDGDPGGDNPRNRGLQPRGNFHPTVKPVELMRWLVRLVTPPGGTVLDPFCGSGTTGMACRYELREFIGIERQADYVAIAERRIAAVAPLFA